MDRMCSNVLAKSKEGKPCYVIRAKLMNCPIEHDDEAESARMHTKLDEGGGTQDY